MTQCSPLSGLHIGEPSERHTGASEGTGMGINLHGIKGPGTAVKFLRYSGLVRCLWHLIMLQTNPTTVYCFCHSHQLQPFQHLVTSNEKGQSGSGAHTVKKMPLEPFCHDSIEHSGYTEDEQLRQGGVWKSASVPRVPERPVAALQLQVRTLIGSHPPEAVLSCLQCKDLP